MAGTSGTGASRRDVSRALGSAGEKKPKKGIRQSCEIHDECSSAGVANDVELITAGTCGEASSE
jgi:hypothetical protein